MVAGRAVPLSRFFSHYGPVECRHARRSLEARQSQLQISPLRWRQGAPLSYPQRLRRTFGPQHTPSKTQDEDSHRSYGRVTFISCRSSASRSCSQPPACVHLTFHRSSTLDYCPSLSLSVLSSLVRGDSSWLQTPMHRQ